MRIVDLISMGKEYLILGVIGISIIMVIVFAVYRFLLKGKKKCKLSKVFGWVALGSYMVIVLGVTLLSRTETWGEWKCFTTILFLP